MNCKTVGLFNKDTRIYYLDNEFVVLNNPVRDEAPTLIKRNPGTPALNKIHSILKVVKMQPVNGTFHRSDGLWCQELTSKGGD